MLDGRAGIGLDAVEQELAEEQCPVQGAPVEDGSLRWRIAQVAGRGVQ